MIKEKFVSLASHCCVHTTESEGDCRRHGVYARSKRLLALLCIPQTLSIMHFPALPAERRGQSARAHTCTHTMAYSNAWHLTTLSAEQCRGKDGRRLTATAGFAKVAWGGRELWLKRSLTKHDLVTSQVASLWSISCLRLLFEQNKLLQMITGVHGDKRKLFFFSLSAWCRS